MIWVVDFLVRGMSSCSEKELLWASKVYSYSVIVIVAEICLKMPMINIVDPMFLVPKSWDHDVSK